MDSALTPETSAHAVREPKWVAMVTGGPGGSLAPYTVAVVSWLALACVGLALVFLIAALIAVFIFGVWHWLEASIGFFLCAVVFLIFRELLVAVMRPRPY